MLVALCDVRKRVRNGCEHVIVAKFKLESEEISYNTVEAHGEPSSNIRPGFKGLFYHPSASVGDKTGPDEC